MSVNGKTVDDVRHFVVTYDVDTADVGVQVFGSDQYQAAVHYFRQREVEVYQESQKHRRLRILFFSADSEEVLRVTHAHYFAGRATRIEDEAWDEPLVANL